MRLLRRRGQRGVSMVEAMIAMGIFTVGLLGVMQMQVISSTQNSDAGRAMRASSVARTMLTIVNRYPYKELTACRRHTAEFSETDFRELEKPNGGSMTPDLDLHDPSTRNANCKLSFGEVMESAVQMEHFDKKLVFEPYKDASGAEVGLKVAAIVAWREGPASAGRKRHVVLHGVVFDPSKNFATIHDL